MGGSPEETSGTATAAGPVGGKYLTFALGAEEYGIDILKVREIMQVLDITRVPQTAPFVKGVFNLRGKVIPVVDLRARFGMPDRPHDDQTCIIVVDVGTLMGVIVDTVRQVQDIPASAIDPPPSVDGRHAVGWILGVGKAGRRVTILLDIDGVLNAEPLVVE